MRVLLAVFALLAIYVPAALVLNMLSHPEGTILSGPFVRYANSNAFISHPVLPGAIADDEDHREQSTLALYEDEKLLGPAHSANVDVQIGGRGHYSFWRHGSNLLLFSTSDNSDPNTNGRTYRVSDPKARDPYQAQRR
ncbi:hypothetical protein [Bradyrhizobium sp. BR13661]|jgi:hypothetical protein|uniref:hypothetical protein n=1 Tax=Bradyrhizobium sp. BR13661 TaxID=2940622 RepID=UPI00247688C3|nr:hypothetical protein [Bradyrhizobium sp. BR13661]MDH6261638.1 hypothetical protein [Bradyrhizobium sp. BR13661]